MRRKLYNKLIEWKQSKGRKPLILRGARQVGKTYLLEEFGKQEFNKTIYLNFERKPHLGSIFERDLSIERIISEIEIEFNTKITPEDTLIIFDEIQEAQKALTSLKYFCEEGPNYYIAGAGSLLGLKTGEGSFPVGKVHFLELYPLNFLVFLLAFDEEKLISFLLKTKTIEQISESIHLICLDYLKLYFYLGGMPEVIKNYLDNRDLNLAREIQIDLLMTYSNDFSKHAGKTESIKIQELWDSIPKQLAREQKKFKYAEIKKGARSKDYEQAISWLIIANLCHKVQCVKKPEFPLAHFTDDSFFKILLFDTGLLGAKSLISANTLLKGSDLFGIFKGAFTESFVGQEMKSFGITNLYYWKSKYEAEVDFLIERENDILPVEVKSGESGKLKSLNLFADKYASKFKIRISANNFYQRDNFVNLPLYGMCRFF